MNVNKNPAPRGNAGNRAFADAPAAPASHKRAADRTVDGWEAADAIAEWSDLGALRPLRVSKFGRRTIVTSDDADEWLSNRPALHGELDEAAP